MNMSLGSVVIKWCPSMASTSSKKKLSANEFCATVIICRSFICHIMSCIDPTLLLHLIGLIFHRSYAGPALDLPTHSDLTTVLYSVSLSLVMALARSHISHLLVPQRLDILYVFH